VLSRVDFPWAPTGIKRDATIADAWRGGFKTVTAVDKKSASDKMIRHCPPGHDLRRTFNERMAGKMVTAPGDKAGRTRVVGRPPFSVKRLRALNEPSHVITGGRSFIHPVEHRYLTVEEQAALCGYPRGYRFIGPVGGRYAQIGKAVMPPVGEYLARIVAAGLVRNKKPPVLSPEEVTIHRDRVDRRDADAATGMAWTPPPPPDPTKTTRAPRRAQPAAAGGSNGAAHAPYKGSGYRIRQMLVEGKLDTAGILAVVHKEFPDSKAGPSDVSWNKAKLRAQGGVP
jgi:hypothetical protein